MKTLEEALVYIKDLERHVEKLQEASHILQRRFFIPTVGTEVKTIKDTLVDVYFEHRNEKFIKSIIGEYDKKLLWRYAKKEVGELPKGVKTIERKWTDTYLGERVDTNYILPVTIPCGTTLIVDRVYIRKGISDFDSITFRLGKKQSLKGRFWLKRSDVNELIVEVVKEDPT